MEKKTQDLVITTNTLKGISRFRNQDDILILNNDFFYLVILFDGVSSLENSIDYVQICKKYIKRNYLKYLMNDPKLNDLMYDMHLYSLKSKIKGKSTCSALLIYPKHNISYVLNIGDSRIYAFSNHFLEPLTKDDTLIGNSNILIKCLGNEGLKYDDFVQKTVETSNNFLLCSDGFYSLMEANIKRYFSILHFKRRNSIINAIDKIQRGFNNDDSTYIIIKQNGL